jgi:hypothetical protein
MHPKKEDIEYRKNVTSASVLYPLIAIFSGLVDDTDTYNQIASLKKNQLQHCNFQFWYPDSQSEDRLYTNSEAHGATLSDIRVDLPREDFLKQVFTECEHSPQFSQLSAVRFGYWPLIVLACRHYRLPLPVHFLRTLEEHDTEGTSGNSTENSAAAAS